MDDLRQRYRARRSDLGPDESARLSRRICRFLTESEPWSRATRIAGYHAISGEADVADALDLGVRQGKTMHLPVLDGDHLLFAPWTPNAPSTLNRFGIPEPDHHPDQRIGPEELELVLTPLVVFDARGHRVGQGAGFYDRSFAFLAGRNRPARPLLIGIAYDLQRADDIAPNPWDIPLDGIVTESGWIRCDPPGDQQEQ